jgi:hypothetical protein
MLIANPNKVSYFCILKYHGTDAFSDIESIVHSYFAYYSDRKEPHGRHRHRWKDDIKIGLEEIECRLIHWKAFVNLVMTLPAP